MVSKAIEFSESRPCLYAVSSNASYCSWREVTVLKSFKYDSELCAAASVCLSVRLSAYFCRSLAAVFRRYFSARYRTAFPLDEREEVTARCGTSREAVDAVCQSRCTWMRLPFSDPAMPARSLRRRFPQLLPQSCREICADEKLLTVTNTMSSSNSYK